MTGLGNLDFMKGFRRVTPRIKPEAWTSIALELKSLHVKLVQAHDDVRAAQAKTRNIYMWREIGHKLRDNLSEIFVSTKGKQFAFLRNGDATDVYHWEGRRRRRVEIPGVRIAGARPEIFESSSGDVLYAWVDQWSLRVVKCADGKRC